MTTMLFSFLALFLDLRAMQEDGRYFWVEMGIATLLFFTSGVHGDIPSSP
jgi:hypothetical protein